MYKSRHNIGRRSAAERVWTYKECDIAINGFNWAAIKGRPPKDGSAKNKTRRRQSTLASGDSTEANAETSTSNCRETSPCPTATSESCGKAVALSDVQAVPSKARVSSPKKGKMPANIQSGRVDKEGRRAKNKCVPPIRQRMKRMACLNANAIVSLLYESGESSVKKSQRELSRSDSNDNTGKETHKKERKGKELAGKGLGKGKGVGKSGRVAKVKKRRRTEADRLGMTPGGVDVPVKLARRMASLNATAILTAMTDKMVKPAPKAASSREKQSPAKKVVSDNCHGDTDVVTSSTPQVTPAKTNVSGSEKKTTVIDKNVELYSSAMDVGGATFTGISDIKKMMATVTSTSPDVQITSIEPPKTLPHSNAGVQYKGVPHSSRQPSCVEDRVSRLPGPTTFANSVLDKSSAQSNTRLASACNLPPGGRSSARTTPCEPSSFGHLQRVMPQMYFNPAVNYPNPSQPKDLPTHMVNYTVVNRPSASNMPVGYNMMLMSNSPVNSDMPLAVPAPTACTVGGMRLKVEKPCAATQQPVVRYSTQMFQPRYPPQNAPQIDRSFARHNSRCAVVTPSAASRMEYGQFPLGVASRKTKLSSSNSVDKCHKKEFDLSCVDGASEKSLHSVADTNVVYGGVRSNFSAAANGGYAMEHREGAPPAPVIVMNSCVQGCTHERAHNSSLMGNVCMYPYPHSKGVEGADTHCQTYAVSDLGMSYEAVLPYPRSFGSAFTVPNFSGIDYPEDYSYFHSVAPDSCCLPHPLAAPHPQVKVLVHNSAGRPVVDRDGELESAAQPQMLHAAAATKAVIQPTREGRLGQLTNLEKVGRNPQTTLGKSGKELRQSSSNGNSATKTPVKTGTGNSRAVEKPSKKSDCTKVDNKSLSKKCDTPGKNDDHKAKKDPQNSTNPKKKSDTVSKQEKKQQEPAKTKPKKDAEVIKIKKEQEGTKTKKSSSDVTKTSKDQPEAKKPKKAAEPAKPKKGADIEKTKKAEAVKQRRDSAPKSPVQLKKSDKSAAKDDVACQRSRSSDKVVVKVTPGLKKKDVQLMRRSSPHGWRWQGEPQRKPVFSQVDQPPVMHDCYPSICHDDGDVIKVRDCVLVKSGPRKKDIPFVGKVAAFWQNPDNEMMMSVLWYYRPEHTETERLPQFIDSEIFASKHRDAIPVACVDDKCHVLTFNQYCRYRAEQCCAEQAQLSLTRHVPKLPEALSSDATLMPLLDADPETVFLCRRVYDIKLKRVLKNPQVQWRDTPRLSSSTAGSESALCVDTHLMNSGSILAPASKNLSP